MLPIDLLMASIISLLFLKVPTQKPYTAPGIQNNKKISGTIDCINGALKSAKEPLGPLSGESSDQLAHASNARPATITKDAK